MRLRCTCICTRTSTCNADQTRPDQTRPDPFCISPLRDNNSFLCLNNRPRARAIAKSAMEGIGMTSQSPIARMHLAQARAELNAALGKTCPHGVNHAHVHGADCTRPAPTTTEAARPESETSDE